MNSSDAKKRHEKLKQIATEHREEFRSSSNAGINEENQLNSNIESDESVSIGDEKNATFETTVADNILSNGEMNSSSEKKKTSEQLKFKNEETLLNEKAENESQEMSIETGQNIQIEHHR